jgi:hypothetical protein
MDDTEFGHQAFRGIVIDHIYSFRFYGTLVAASIGVLLSILCPHRWTYIFSFSCLN